MAAIFGGDEVNAVVLDLGSWQTKAGYAGDDTPKACFPSFAGAVAARDGDEGDGGAAANGMDVDGASPSAKGGGKAADGAGAAAAAAAEAGDKKKQQQQQQGRRTLYVGSQELGYRRPHMEVVSPFDADGALSDGDVVKALWDHALRGRLAVDPKENAVLLAEPTHSTREARERIVELAFEALSCPALYLARDAVLATFSVAKQTGVVVDAGHAATTIAAVHDGFVLTKSVSRSPVGGRLLTRCLQAAIEAREGGGPLRPRQTFRRVERKGFAATAFEVVDLDDNDQLAASFLAFQRELIAADVKEAASRVNDQHFVAEANMTVPAVSYELPDGTEIQVGVDRFKVPECLFQPQLVHSFPGMADAPLPEGLKGLAGALVDAVNRCDVDVRKDLYQHVVLCGGTSMLPQLRERLETEVLAAAPGGTRVKVTAPVNPTERRHAVWIGGSILASLGSFQQLWMSRQEYDEHGAGIVHRKCP